MPTGSHKKFIFYGRANKALIPPPLILMAVNFFFFKICFPSWPVPPHVLMTRKLKNSCPPPAIFCDIRFMFSTYHDYCFVKYLHGSQKKSIGSIFLNNIKTAFRRESIFTLKLYKDFINICTSNISKFVYKTT